MCRSKLLVSLAGLGLCAAVSAGLLAACGGVDMASGASAASPAAADVPTWLLEQAQREATNHGDPHPGLAEWVISHRAEATQVLTGETVSDGDPEVYVLVLKGHFADSNGFGPTTADESGTWLLAVLDARTHEILDFGLGDQPIQLSKLGTVHSFMF